MIFLDINSLLITLGKAAVVVPIIQLLIAGVPTALKRWFIEKKDFSKRSNYLIEKLTEEASIKLYEIFERGLNTQINLRGNPPANPDLLYPYHERIQENTNVVLKIRLCYDFYKILDFILMCIALIAAILSVLVLLAWNLPILLLISLLLIGLEIILILLMYHKTSTLERFEDKYL